MICMLGIVASVGGSTRMLARAFSCFPAHLCTVMHGSPRLSVPSAKANLTKNRLDNRTTQIPNRPMSMIPNSRRALRLVVIVLGTITPTMALAEIYKWVDEKGIVNYGSEPPKGARKTEKLDAKVPTVSIVSPNAAASLTGAKYADQALRQRVERLERDLEDERRTRAAAAQTYDETEQLRLRQAREQCERERRVDCNVDPFGTRYGTGWVIAPAVGTRIRPPFRQPVLLPAPYPREEQPVARELVRKDLVPRTSAQPQARH